MKKYLFIIAALLLIIGFLLFRLIPLPNICQKGVLNFEPPSFTSGQTYHSPTQIYNNHHGLAANILEFIFVSGTRNFGYGEIQRRSSPNFFGNGQAIRLNSTVLNFDLEHGTTKAQVDYLFQGGTINLGANGSLNSYIGDMYVMPSPLVINGVTIKKQNNRNILNPQGVRVAETGTLIFYSSSQIGGMFIGGEELFLDDFCFE